MTSNARTQRLFFHISADILPSEWFRAGKAERMQPCSTKQRGMYKLLTMGILPGSFAYFPFTLLIPHHTSHRLTGRVLSLCRRTESTHRFLPDTEKNSSKSIPQLCKNKGWRKTAGHTPCVFSPPIFISVGKKDSLFPSCLSQICIRSGLLKMSLLPMQKTSRRIKFGFCRQTFPRRYTTRITLFSWYANIFFPAFSQNRVRRMSRRLQPSDSLD